MSVSPAEVSETLRRKDTRDRWFLTAPALVLIGVASAGPLLIVVLYSFLAPGSYGVVKWVFSTDGWFNVFFSRDYKREFEELIGQRRAPEDPTVYLCADDRVGDGAVPETERAFFISNAPPLDLTSSTSQSSKVARSSAARPAAWGA